MWSVDAIREGTQMEKAAKGGGSAMEANNGRAVVCAIRMFLTGKNGH